MPLRFYYNGTFTHPEGTGICPPDILRGNYVYAAINTAGHAPLYLSRHLHFAAGSYENLYGIRPEFDTAEVSEQIRRLLAANRLPKTGNIIYIYLIPPQHRPAEPGRTAAQAKDAGPDVIIAHDRTTIYNGYALISIRPAAVVTNYGLPFEQHRTAISLMAAQYMDAFAGRSGAGCALRVNREGKLLSSGDYPVFMVRNGVAYTPPAGRGIGDSVERGLMMRACAMEGVGVVERDIDATELPEAEELMVFNHTGIRSILSCNGTYYYNLVGLRLERALDAITEAGKNPESV